MVIDPEVFRQEITALQKSGMLLQDELRVSLDAHVIFPFHRWLDGGREDQVGGTRIGTTRRGIGPAYEAKAARRGIRVRDLLHPERLRARLIANAAIVNAELERLGAEERLEVDAEVARATGWVVWMRPLLCDTGELIDASIRAGERVLIEGAQGALLDLDHGTYPYVTSSTTLAGGACSGLGIGPTAIDRVWGITKAYTTRVGAGPFPTRLDDEQGELLRQAGDEFGATTGRPRDCGWLDLPALRFAARRSGLTGLCVTKLDILAKMPAVAICRSYADGVVPGRDELDLARPVLESLPGWGDPELASQIALARRLEDLPAPARAYLDIISEAIEVPIALVSVGPGRDQTVFIDEAF
jgi:adenylosuccinate synthase